jgi:hypothetical protein
MYLGGGTNLVDLMRLGLRDSQLRCSAALYASWAPSAIARMVHIPATSRVTRGGEDIAERECARDPLRDAIGTHEQLADRVPQAASASGLLDFTVPRLSPGSE